MTTIGFSTSTTTQEDRRTVPTDEGDHERFSHYVEKDKLTEAMVMGTPVVALCGKVWVPEPGAREVPGLPRLQGHLGVAEGRRRRHGEDSGGDARSDPARTRLARASSVGDGPSLRAWQTAAMHDYVARSPRDFLAVATPGAGKTTFALTVAAELLGRRVVDRITIVAPTEHLKLQWAEAAARAGIPVDPTYAAGKGRTSQGLRRHRRDLRRRRGQPARHADPHRAASRRW